MALGLLNFLIGTRARERAGEWFYPQRLSPVRKDAATGAGVLDCRMAKELEMASVWTLKEFEPSLEIPLQ